MEIIVKRSSVEGKAPETLKPGELAMNLTDQALYSSNVEGTIFRLNPTYVSVESINSATDILPEEPNLDNIINGINGNICWNYNSTTKTLSISPVEGTDGSMSNYVPDGCGDNVAPWIDYKSEIETIIVDSNIVNMALRS